MWSRVFLVIGIFTCSGHPHTLDKQLAAATDLFGEKHPDAERGDGGSYARQLEQQRRTVQRRGLLADLVITETTYAFDGEAGSSKKNIRSGLGGR